jgi:hypothetical protein
MLIVAEFASVNVTRLQDGVLHIDLGVTDWSDVVTPLGEAWPLVARAVEELVAAKPDWQWTRLRAYVRFDGGFIWFSPDPERPRQNANVAGVGLACLDALYHELPDVETEQDAFERAHEEMDQRVFDVLRRSALLPGASAALVALQRLRPHAITFVQYDDLETERTLVDLAELRDAAGK